MARTDRVEVRDAEGRVRASPDSLAAAHRATRRADMGGSSLNRARVRVEAHEVWSDGRLLYSGVNQSEARRTFVRAAIPDPFAFARALGLGQTPPYPPSLELREVDRRGRTLSSTTADSVDPRRMQRLYKQWDYPGR